MLPSPEEPEVEDHGVGLLPGPDLLHVAAVDVAQLGDGLEDVALPQSVRVGLGDADPGQLPHSDPAGRPPERDVGRVVEVVAERRLGVLAERRAGVDEDTVAFAGHGDRIVVGDVDDQLRRPVALGGAEVGGTGVAGGGELGVGLVEEELGGAERVLVQGCHLVLLVRATVRRHVGTPVVVRRHVEQAQVQRRGTRLHDLGIGAELAQHQESGDVLDHVDVGVPLEEPEAGALVDPGQDVGFGPLGVLGAGHAGDGELRVGEELPGQPLVAQRDDPVVLGPVPEVVDPIVGERVVVAVPVGDGAFLDGSDDRGIQLGHGRVALTERQHPVEVHEAEVAGVLPRVDLVPGVLERVDGDGVDVPGVLGVAPGLSQVHGDAGEAGRIVGGGGEGEVVVHPRLIGRLVHQARGARRRQELERFAAGRDRRRRAGRCRAGRRVRRGRGGRGRCVGLTVVRAGGQPGHTGQEKEAASVDGAHGPRLRHEPEPARGQAPSGFRFPTWPQRAHLGPDPRCAR